ncbi:hypothetical protein DSO57_1007461 [Entomophthora muscae]|uniref:Uncharacterized protein n=1 Tax=Entomophthora muscae TaxID=34485 RepID=A0ACC2SWM9_9FUNG|nr:hypothetical protein DSO57_1007461 [Entomophthora muscae]
MSALSNLYTQDSTAERAGIESNANHIDERATEVNQKSPGISNINANMGAPDKVIAENDDISKSIPDLVVINPSNTAERASIESNANHIDERATEVNQKSPGISNINANMGAPDKVIAENDDISKSIPDMVVINPSNTAERASIESNANHIDERATEVNQKSPGISNSNANMGATNKVITENNTTSKSIPGLVVMGSSFGGEDTKVYKETESTCRNNLLYMN